MSEYYIKQPDTDHTRGPLNIEQLISLAETGMVVEDTLIYDELTEKWKPLSSYPELIPVVFPEKRTLTINKQEMAPTEREVTEEIAEGKAAPKISTEKILAAASGDTKETKHIGNVVKSREKAAEITIPGIGAVLAITAFALIYPGRETILNSIETQAIASIFKNPLILIGLLDAILAALVFMGVTSVFTVVRALSAITFGFTAYLFWAWGNPILITLSGCMTIGLLIATVSSRFGWMITSLALAVIGATTLSYLGFAEILSY